MWQLAVCICLVAAMAAFIILEGGLPVAIVLAVLFVAFVFSRLSPTSRR